MTNKASLENQVSAVKKYLKIIERYKPYSKQEIESDIDIRGAVERYLYLLAQSTIDLGESVIAYKQYRKPETLSEIFYILHEEGLVSNDLRESMVEMTGFRNVMAHDYEDIDYNVIYKVIHESVRDIEQFLKIVTSNVL